MKKIITSIFAFSIASISFGQQITISNVSDLDLLVSNIFGLQCEGVSNVVLNGAVGTTGRFDNGQQIGMSSGLVLSTGDITPIPFAAQVFMSGVAGGFGDADVQQASMQTSFDAASLEFDFTASTTGNIEFKYIFASEEYPEYVNSSYNDIFLLLVREGANPYTNLALLPSGQTVNINNVNQFLNSSFYIDNSNGTNFGFDGYTTPLTATLAAVEGTTYHFKIVVSDIGDAAFDSAIFLDEQETYNDISGTILVDGVPASGTIEIFNITEDTLIAQAVQTIIVQNGDYLADSLNTGLYHARFTPDPILFPLAVPLYFTNGSTWSEATEIGLPCFTDTSTIGAQSLTLTSYNGSVSGNVLVDTSYLHTSLQAYSGARIIVKNALNQVVGYDLTDLDGNYTIANLPIGTYTILLDVPYIPQVQTHSFTIASNEIAVGYDYAVSTSGIVTTSQGVIQSLLFLEESSQSLFAMYPNPTNGIVTFKVGEKSNVYILDLNGKLISEFTLQTGQSTIDLTHLTKGIYFVKVGSNNPKRLVVLK